MIFYEEIVENNLILYKKIGDNNWASLYKCPSTNLHRETFNNKNKFSLSEIRMDARENIVKCKSWQCDCNSIFNNWKIDND